MAEGQMNVLPMYVYFYFRCASHATNQFILGSSKITLTNYGIGHWLVRQSSGTPTFLWFLCKSAAPYILYT